ncbi:Oxidoreductase, short-chain dehydrogenase/reductase family [Actinokineospora spheciospongiae]|uniref:Oxidoreductase, short-chain dehydrogenase/reductase family n=1 Tax=Actinokineospora spheciospongiae TaxID=909613 RepID=W7ITU1_9PSEU|nr:SDR family oxidoreductase [Actinokineospora spheciospongiae]EWC63778.1 Oxidoreductase, short-chain dehydrogenase/reductase family [Actinokineospora spheciospongiae]
MSRKNILITGASSGLGEEMARQFAALGRNLALAARRTDRLDELRAELTATYPGITVAVRALDVNDHDAVFKVFGEFREELGTLDRVVVNAGLGKGQPIGTGYFYANKQTAETNFVAALAQCEAAMEAFREQDSGHLVVISSMSAMRGMRGNLSTYAATKAGIAALAEGIRVDTLKTPIKVSTIYPGYIRSEMNDKVKKTPLMVDTVPGVRAMVKAIEREVAEACAPSWPWTLLGFAMRNLPLPIVAKMS